MTTPTTIYENPVELLQNLIRFDTTNPPGNEAECITYIDVLLQSLGIETQIFSKAPERPNLIARLKGEGNAAPLLLYGHVDVVTTAGQNWTHPPFAAEIAEGYVWGRGAIDMKGGVAMMLAAFMRAKAENTPLRGDVILCIVSDEEASGEFGAKFLVEEHPDLFADVNFAIGEFGGFTLHVGGKRFYPIMVAEKQVCWMKATIRGAAGHGSLPLRGGAMAKTARILTKLDRNRLPVHITPTAKLQFDTLSSNLSFPVGTLIGQLTNPALTDSVLNILGERGHVFDPALHNTVNATIINGGNKVNVIPSEITLELDGRLLPSFTPADMLRELNALIGDDAEIEVLAHDPSLNEPDMAWFDTLGSLIKDIDPDGIPLPLLLPGVTDGRFFGRLGIQTYGFLPMRLPEDFNFSQTVHAADERIPVEAVGQGAAAIYQALQQTI